MKVSKLIRLIEKNPPSSIRLYLISDTSHYFIHNGKVTSGFSNFKLLKNRTSVLDSFSKMGFLFDEIIRLRIVGYVDNSSSKELHYLLNLIPINRKIRLFLDWKIFDPKFTKKMSRLFEVRNDTIHSISLDEVNYNPNVRASLGNEKGFNKFKKDLTDSWNTLIKIYLIEQNRINLDDLSRDLVL